MTAPTPATWVVAGLSAVAHLVVGVFYLSSGLVAPLWAVVVLAVWWLLLAVQLSRLALRGSWWTPAVPVVAFATWYVVLTVGEQALGWTA
ncbi:hypothetical protein ACI8AF_25520 [Blastococcus sp. SYSU D00669]